MGNGTVDIKKSIYDYIYDNFLLGRDRASLKDEDSFLDKRILDSTGFIELITFVEERFGVQVGDDELMPENLDSVRNLEAFISRKLAS
jgi:acyl carrier protein